MKLGNEDTTALLLDTTPINIEKATEAVNELYRFCGRKFPEIVYLKGPSELTEIDLDEPHFNSQTFNDIAHFVDKRYYDKGDRIHSIISGVFHESLTPKRNTGLIGRYETGPYGYYPLSLPISCIYGGEYDYDKVMTPVWDNTYAIITMEDRCFIMDRPELVKVNDRGFHCCDGPAIVFRDGTEIYAYEGIKVDKRCVLQPHSMTLEDIHQHNSRKHILIDLFGVDNYLELVRAWKPDVKGKFGKFFLFHKMLEKSGGWRDEEGKVYGDYYNDEHPYEIEIFNGRMNGDYATCLFEARNLGEKYVFWRKIEDNPHMLQIFDEKDYALWNLFDFKQASSRGAHKLTVGFKNRTYSLKSHRSYESNPSCYHDIAPAWFKAKMFRNQYALYEAEDYAVRFNDGKLEFAGHPPKTQNSLFRGCENIPSYKFDINLSSDTWEGLLEKWARLSFEWLGMHEDSTHSV